MIRIIIFMLVANFSLASKSFAEDIQVRQIQTMLHELGVNAGAIDGDYGKTTKNALIELGEKFGKNVDLTDYETIYDGVKKIHSTIFDKAATSSIPCDSVADRSDGSEYLINGIWTKNLFEGDPEKCAVIAKFDKVSPYRGNIWDKPFLMKVREAANGELMAVLWAAEEVVAPGVTYDGPGAAHFSYFPISIEKIFANKAGPILENLARDMPFSIRRAELADTDGDSKTELVLLSSREDGRAPKGDQARNQWDKTFIYDFENNSIQTIADPSFSHDLLTVDLNQDGFDEVIDLALDFDSHATKNPRYQICDMKKNKCDTYFSKDFGVSRTSIGFDKSLNKFIIFGDCAPKAIKKKSWEEVNGEVCWFEVSYNSDATSPISYKLIGTAENPLKHNTKQKHIDWMQQKVTFSGAKIQGVDPAQSYITNGLQGYNSKMVDLDNDGDLDTIDWIYGATCKKRDPKAKHYNYSDCDENGFYETRVFTQENKKFHLAGQYKLESEGFLHMVRFEIFDFNNDGLPDISTYLRNQTDKCRGDHLVANLVSTGNSQFKPMIRKDIVGKYGCEINSHFFTYNSEPYRLVFFKSDFRNSWSEKYAHHDKKGDVEPTVYLAIEYLGSNLQQLLKTEINSVTSESLCQKAVGSKNIGGIKTLVWSSFPDSALYVEEAKRRNLNCNVN